MLSKTHKPKNGFTIIEIMIVLAIAGIDYVDSISGSSSAST